MHGYKAYYLLLHTSIRFRSSEHLFIYIYCLFMIFIIIILPSQFCYFLIIFYHHLFFILNETNPMVKNAGRNLPRYFPNQGKFYSQVANKRTSSVRVKKMFLRIIWWVFWRFLKFAKITKNIMVKPSQFKNRMFTLLWFIGFDETI